MFTNRAASPERQIREKAMSGDVPPVQKMLTFQRSHHRDDSIARGMTGDTWTVAIRGALAGSCK
jgi:hypothetical protein